MRRHTIFQTVTGLPILLLGAVLLLSHCASRPESGDGPDLVATASSSLSEDPAIPPAATHPGNLIAVREIDPTIMVDLQYRRADNIAGRPLYNENMPCLVNYETGLKLRKANTYLKSLGYRLKIWDAYRPPSVQRKLFEAAPNGQWVAEPVKHWSHHNFGTGVDVTLSDAKGRDMVMPSSFDEFNDRASFLYVSGNEQVHRNLIMLQRAMVSSGMSAVVDEWWHFNDYKVVNSTLTYAAELGIEMPE